MRIISKKPLREFWEKHPKSRPMLEQWFKTATQCQAISFHELRKTFSSADYVDGFTIFDIAGNHYRLITVIHYDKQRIYIRQIMTHAEYDRNKWKKL